ncbi:hypothetical protein KP509_13G034800 [Ceratopteris richardii]|uniref:Uncharacterized protein n=1 Tax=Ceratopteris richardii TaxID=49495 RepID=A0A8T2TCP3_CERRI|nr:hypothetical protein KP509_13G034800 [Ceratopteris richardii]
MVGYLRAMNSELDLSWICGLLRLFYIVNLFFYWASFLIWTYITEQVADVADYEALSVSIERAFAWRPIDVLVCNAGLTRGGYLGDCMLQDLQITMQTNFIGTVHTLHAALPLLKRYSSSNPVSIVITASLASMFLMYGHAVYTATKYAMRGLAEGLRFELIPYQIRVSVICPGFTSTPFLDEADKDADVRELLQWVDLYNRRWAESTNWVASHVIAAIKSGTFLVTTNPLGLVMATLSRGFVPADSFLRVIFELFFYVPFRLASLIYIPLVRLIVRHKTNTWIRKSTLCPMESSPEKHDESTS